jgi:hypothetical protein
VIVTGGSRGTGREFAHALARAGYAVVIGYAHSQGAADATVDELLTGGAAAIAIRADVADELDVERLFLETRQEFGGVDLVVQPPGWSSVPVRRAAGRHVRVGGAVVRFAGGGQAGRPADIAKVVSWLTAHPDVGSRDATWASFSDPHGNTWLVEEIVTRLPDREPRETKEDSEAVNLSPKAS